MDNQLDAERAFFDTLISIDTDLVSLPEGPRRLEAMRSSGMFQNLPSGEGLAADARNASRVSFAADVEKGLIAARDAELLNLIADGAIASARRDVDTAVRLYERALAVAPAEASAEILLRLGDTYAAPLGSPLLLGVDSGSGTQMRHLLDYGVAPPSMIPPDPNALAVASRWYDRAAAGGDASIVQRVAIRRAYLRFLKGDRAGAATEFERVAAGEGVTAWAASLSAGLLQNRRAAIRRGIAAADAEKYEGALFSFAVTAQTFALASAHLAGNRVQAIEILEHTSDALIDAGSGRLAAEVLSELATLYNQTGRQDAALVAIRQAINLMEAHWQLVEQHMPPGTETDMLRKTEQAALLSRQQTREIYAGRKRTDEQTGGWTKELEALAKKQDEILGPLAGLYREQATNPIDVGKLAALKTEMDEIRTTPDCAGRMDRLRDVRRRSVEAAMPEWLLIFDLTNADCAREWLLEDRKRIESENILKPLATALSENKPADSVAPHVRLVLRSLEVLEMAEGWDALAQHGGKFAALADAVPMLVPFRLQARRYVALASLERGDAAAARTAVAGAVDDPLWPSRIPAERMSLLAIGVEAEAALCERGSCDAPRALHLLALLHGAQREAQFLRSGVSSARKETAERAALEARLARAETMAAADLQRLRELRDVQTSEALPIPPPPTRADVDAVLRALPKDVTALVFHRTRNHVIAWRGGIGELRLVRIADRDRRAESLAVELQSELAAALDGWPELVASIRSLLLVPLGAIPAGHRVVIVAGGTLGAIPFDLVVGHEHAVTITDMLVGAGTAGTTKNAVAVGLNSGPLTNAEEEARAVARLVGGTALTGARATAANVRAKLRDARFVHFATHATLVPENPFETYLTLAGGERLEAWRLFRDAPAARLITLSACEAAARPRALAGQAKDVSESTSLVAFAFAGNARYVLASLWRADDRFALQLMKAFYENLAGNPGDEAGALHRAKLTVANEGAVHPFYWANFVLSARSLEVTHLP
jgi:tetratricopeptide (TPR) repeat protein